MNERSHSMRAALLGGLFAGLCLVGTLALAFAIGLGAGTLLGFGDNPPQLFTTIMVVLALAMLFGGGALWGVALARLTHYPHAWRLVLAVALSYGPAVLLAAFALGRLEPLVVEGAPRLPIHVLFGVLFAPAVFAVVALVGLALGIAVGSLRFGVAAALGGGLASALAFLAVDALLDTLGMRVGAPGAEERATMITVLTLGDFGAALAGGAVFSRSLARFVAAAEPRSIYAAQTPTS